LGNGLSHGRIVFAAYDTGKKRIALRQQFRRQAVYLVFVDLELIFNDLTELTGIKGGRVTGGLTPDAITSQFMCDQANASKGLNPDVPDVDRLPGDARMYKEEVDHEVMTPSAANHRATEA
jgi:hypothetical protein